MADETPTTASTGGFRFTKIQSNGKDSANNAAFSPTGDTFVVTFGNGRCHLYNSATLSVVGQASYGADSPSTGVSWRPGNHFEEDEKISQFAATSSDGGVACYSWDTTSPDESFLERAWRAKEPDNDTTNCAFNCDGTVLATGGSDRIVRLYDPATQKCVTKMDKGIDENGHSRSAHTNRIFSVRFTSSPNICITGGWDSPLQVWDIREGKSVRHMTGAMMGSDGLELIPNTDFVAVASNRQTKQITVFDINTAREWTDKSDELNAHLGKATLSTIRACGDVGLWATSTKPTNELRFIDWKTGEVKAHSTSLPAHPMGMATSEHHPGKAILCGMHDSVILCELE